MLPLSKLNELRRRAIAAWEENLISTRSEADFCTANAPISQKKPQRCLVARFANPSQITSRAKAFFDRIELPLHQFTADADGVILPPVIFNSDRDRVSRMLAHAASLGATSVSVGNIGHLPLARESGLRICGDFRLNVTNSKTAAQLEELGIDEILLSPELTLPRIRDIKGNTAAVVYGRIPLMTLEKCVIREVAGCKVCDEGRAVITDRRGVTFPVLREWEHRNVIYNSLPTCMSDREDELERFGILNRHFFFTTESPKEVDAVIEAFESHTPLGTTVRRLAR